MRHHRQRGVSLIEALLGFVVLSLGLLALARMQTRMQQGADLARQRAEASRVAEQDIETLRAFGALTAPPDVPSYAAIVSASAAIDAAALHTNTTYGLVRQIVDDDAAGFKSARLAIAWTDRTGLPQQVTVDSLISRSAPVLSASLVVARRQAATAIAGRSAIVPLAARSLGDGRSVLKPAAAGSIAYVFDNTTGRIVARCSSLATTLATRDIVAADLSHCDAADAVLLSGIVRWSLALPPDPAQADDAPLPLGLTLSLVNGPYPKPPECIAEAQKVVSYLTAMGTRREAVPIDATPASIGLASWVELPDRFVAYHCMVTPAAGGRWSGRSTVSPQGWTIGTTAATYRVCRYSADQDGSGGIDSNAEHPASYSEVEGALMQQNFLVVRGDQTCPLAAAVSTTVFVDLSTVAHQP